MHLLCQFKSHSPAATVMENQGFAFSRCRRCHCDLVRSLTSSDSGWRDIPSGFRVAWRGADLSVFAVSSRLERMRAVMRKLGQRASGHAAALAETARNCCRTLFAGWHMLFSFAAILLWVVGRDVRSWAKKLRYRFAAGGDVLRLQRTEPAHCVFIINFDVQSPSGRRRGRA